MSGWPQPGSTARSLINSAIANTGASVVLVLRNMLDSYYAAHVSLEALAALSVTVPVSLLLIGLSMGVSVVTGHEVALRHRAGSTRESGLILHALIAALGWALITILLLGFSFPLAIEGYVASPILASRATTLFYGLLAGTPLLYLYGTLTAALRALDRADLAARATVIGLGIGALLTGWLMSAHTPLTLAEPLLGIAIGLASGYGLAALIALSALRRHGHLPGLSADRNNLYADVRLIVRRAIPVMTTNLVSMLAMFIVTGVASNAGTSVVAAFGAVFRIEQFGMIALNSIVLAIVPMAARSLRDNDRKTLREVMYTGFGLIFVVSSLIGVGLCLASGAIARLFELPEDSANLLELWLRFVSVALFFQGVTLAITGVVQIRRARLALIINLVRLYGVMLPLLWFFSQRSVAAIYPSMSCTHILAGLVLLTLLWRLLPTQPKP